MLAALQDRFRAIRGLDDGVSTAAKRLTHHGSCLRLRLENLAAAEREQLKGEIRRALPGRLDVQRSRERFCTLRPVDSIRMCG